MVLPRRRSSRYRRGCCRNLTLTLALTLTLTLTLSLSLSLSLSLTWEAAGVTREALEEVPEAIRHEALQAVLSQVDPEVLRPEPGAEGGPGSGGASKPGHMSASLDATPSFTAAGARPAQLVAGDDAGKKRMGGTMVEKFEFERWHAFRWRSEP